MKKHLIEACHYCGQKIDRVMYLKNMKARMRKAGLPSLAKLITILDKK